jgi:hypothetical protein
MIPKTSVIIKKSYLSWLSWAMKYKPTFFCGIAQGSQNQHGVYSQMFLPKNFSNANKPLIA